jgi:hypothetical protein
VSTPNVERAAWPALLTIWSTRPNRSLARVTSASGTSALAGSQEGLDLRTFAAAVGGDGGEAAFVLPGVEEERAVRPGQGSGQRGADAARCAGDHHHPFRSVRHDIPLPRSPAQPEGDYQYTAFLDMESIQVPNSANLERGKCARWTLSSSAPGSAVSPSG